MLALSGISTGNTTKNDAATVATGLTYLQIRAFSTALELQPYPQLQSLMCYGSFNNSMG